MTRTRMIGFMSLGIEIINYTYIWSLNKFKLKIYPQDFVSKIIYYTYENLFHSSW